MYVKQMDLVEILAPFECVTGVTDMTQGHNHVTASVVIPVIR